ncbi:hypothetical protein DYU05_19870 [Mucilaginibacter terrenus]|uniref:TonB C-terminal domain-containing protein n=1 Tax=Mucilaginibacter terrenus TaxID=2482727 RepID=A0A3E2NJR5_9SPHI|nr:hypothetical protein [Mucilaginibacter terrenus]RFZ81242.1 hypothetical protein DYU05_19870 [Mucilaginibacter terrenus]
MKKLLIIALFILSSALAKAQEGDLAFPFQGGSPIMIRFFTDSLQVGQDIKDKKASGMAVIKFTADISGQIQKIVIYYADDYMLTLPVIEALRKSNKKWIIPNKEKFHDFIIPFSISYNAPATGVAEVQKAAYAYFKQRKPILTKDQLPLNAATLLPVVVVKYDL